METCHACKQEKPVKYYVAQWQKKYMIPLPFPYCKECAESKEDLTLYQDYLAEMERGSNLAPANNVELS